MKLRHVTTSTVAGLILLAAASLAWAFIQQPPMWGIPVKVGKDIQISYKGTINGFYILQASTNLASTNWVNVVTNRMGVAGSAIIVDSNAIVTQPYRFYKMTIWTNN